MEAVDSATKRARVFVCAGVGERACVYVRANLNHVTAPPAYEHTSARNI